MKIVNESGDKRETWYYSNVSKDLSICIETISAGREISLIQSIRILTSVTNRIKTTINK